MIGNLFLAAALVLLLPFAPVPQSAVAAQNFLWVNPDVCTAGQPSLEDLDRLKEEGLKGVLNLRRPSESPFQAEEERHARSIGLSYFNIPVDSSNPREDQVRQFLEIVGDETHRPLLVHCSSANRVGAFWMIHRVLKDGWSVERAEAEARRIGLTSPGLLEFAQRYIRSR